jgi:hypothetical protein
MPLTVIGSVIVLPAWRGYMAGELLACFAMRSQSLNCALSLSEPGKRLMLR